MPHQAEIIAVGTELLLGNIANTNAQFLSQLLASAGVNVLYHTAVGDNPQRLRAAVETARSRCDLLVFTGGLGPTYDDMTKETVAGVFGLALEYHPEVMEEIQQYFDRVFHRPMPACNRQQAMLPQGCTVLHNPVGTAPGCMLTAGGVTAVLLPGVPHECRYLAEHAVLPWLRGQSGGVIRSRDLHVFGLTEPQVQELLGDLMDGAQNPSLAPYAKPGEVMLRLTAKGGSDDDCQERMAPLFRDVRSRLGDYLYGVDVSSLEEVVLTRLRQQGLTLSAAESCTGGLIAKRLTDVAGASAAFLGGVVSYTNGVKAGVLGVPRDLLDRYGAVSAPVARAMAEGVRRVTGSDLSVSVTGLAGPDGDDRGNPVGTVYVGLSWQGGSLVRHLTLGGDRARIRLLVASNALDIIRRHLCDLPVEGEEVYGS